MAAARHAIIIWARPDGETWYWRDAAGSRWAPNRSGAREYRSIGAATRELEAARAMVPPGYRVMVRVQRVER